MPQSHEIIPFDTMSEEQRLEALISYAKQNPKKYAEKKDHLLKKYNISLSQAEVDKKIVEPVTKDVADLEKVKVKRTKKN